MGCARPPPPRVAPWSSTWRKGVLQAMQIRLLPAVGIAAVLAAGCGSAPSTAAKSLSLSTARLASYTASYHIVGPATGTATWSIAQPSNGETEVTVQTTIATTAERDAFTVSSPGLSLRSASERITAPGEKVTIAAQPKGQTMQVSATVNGRVETPKIALHSPWLVNELLLPAISGVALSPTASVSVEDVLVQHASSVPLALTVGAETTLATSIGSVRCYPVTLSAGGAEQTAWYEAAAPHAMLKYVDGKESYVLSALTP